MPSPAHSAHIASCLQALQILHPQPRTTSLIPPSSFQMKLRSSNATSFPGKLPSLFPQVELDWELFPKPLTAHMTLHYNYLLDSKSFGERVEPFISESPATGAAC